MDYARYDRAFARAETWASTTRSARPSRRPTRPIWRTSSRVRLVEAEQSVRLSVEERAELIRDNTRKRYMAFTRAGERLAITYVGGLPSVLQPFHAQANGQTAGGTA
jgi:hypothetical protein